MKPKLVITNVGIQAASAAKTILDALHPDSATLKALMAGKGFSNQQAAEHQQIQQWQNQLASGDPQMLDKMPPEIKSLEKIGVANDDQLIFYATETPPSAYAARLLSLFYRRRLRAKPQWEVVPGLQATDASRFSQGVQKYIKLVTDVVQRWRDSHDIILNATSGFKSLIPYMTLIGALNGLTMQYIFEQSPTLLTLPFVRLQFDRALFDRYGETLFRRIDEQSSIPRAEIERLPDFADLQPFLELMDDAYTLSPLGFIFYETYKDDLAIPRSSRKPEQKDKLREPGQEPHRPSEFELFRQKLAQHPHVDEFRYLKGCAPDKKQVRRVGGSDNILHIDYAGITVEVTTTARAKTRDLDTIEQEMRELLNSLP
jgi:putative CRISPR-associated protein (TIGR02619 family)